MIDILFISKESYRYVPGTTINEVMITFHFILSTEQETKKH